MTFRAERTQPEGQKQRGSLSGQAAAILELSHAGLFAWENRI